MVEEDSSMSQHKKSRLSDVFEIFNDHSEMRTLLESCLDDISHCKHYSVGAMKINACNAGYKNSGYPFSKAMCDTDMYEHLYYFSKIFQHGENILHKYLQANSVPSDMKMKAVLSKFLSFVLDERSHRALEQIQHERLSETELSMRYGHHLFSKLLHSSQCKLDQFCQDKENIDVCPCGCHEKFNGIFADTSIGNPRCWHGNINILIDGTVPVKVQEESEEHGYSSGDESPVEGKLGREDIVSDTDIISQTVAQTIVSSFLQKKRQPKNIHFLTPGIYISPAFISFYFYDCQHDILLRSPVFELFTYERKVNMRAVLAVWLVVNYKHLSSGVTDSMINNGYTSGFYDLAEEKLQLYQRCLTAEGVVGFNERDSFNPGILPWDVE